MLLHYSQGNKRQEFIIIKKTLSLAKAENFHSFKYHFKVTFESNVKSPSKTNLFSSDYISDSLPDVTCYYKYFTDSSNSV